MEQIAYIDLSSKRVSTKNIPDEMLQQYLGGRGINAYLLYNHTKKGLDPMSPENPLIIGAGLLGGHCVTASGRIHITGKSPDTGVYGDSNAGGYFAPELKYAGFQHLVVKGKADRPTYLWVHDGEIELKDASHLWGLDTYQTQLKIAEELGDPEVKTICIGPAGENLVSFACVRHWLKRTAGKSGMGCLMGSKQLKAIAARGTRGLAAKRPEKLLELTKKQYDYARSTKIFQIASRWSNFYAWVMSNEGERLSVRNFQHHYFPEGYGNIDIDIFMRDYSEKMLACFGCPMHCQHRYQIKTGPFAGLKGEGPEWMCQLFFCANLGNTRYDSALASMEACNRYGIDCSTYGALLGGLMHLWQEGIINEKDTGGLNLEWGNQQAMVEMVRQIVNREHLGGIVADGIVEAAKRIGKGSEQYLRTCGKGLHLEAGNVKMLRASALGFLTSNRGNDHLRGVVNLEFMNLPPKVLEDIFWRPVDPDQLSWQGKAWMAIWTQHLYSVSDATGLCRFWTKFFAPDMFGFDEPTEMINAVTGWDISREQLLEIGERIWNIERLFNVRDGLGRKHDMPPRLWVEPIKEGMYKGIGVDLDKYEKLLDEYYDLHGWDREGNPTAETLKRLNLEREPSHIL